jgi:2-polyprenyl-3-methyl-5-hydroxy-6-metoxy-1,4-benzoquinol methylase
MTGVDIAEQNIATARQKANETGFSSDQLHFITAFAGELTTHCGPNSYDAALVFELLEHVPDVKTVLVAIEKVVRPEGTILVTVPIGFLEAAYREICQTDSYAREYVRHFSTEEIQTIFGSRKNFRMEVIKAKTGEEKWFGISYTNEGVMETE